MQMRSHFETFIAFAMQKSPVYLRKERLKGNTIMDAEYVINMNSGKTSSYTDTIYNNRL